MKIQKQLLMIMLMLAMGLMLMAQSTTINFEPGGSGAAMAWTMDQNGSNPPLTFPANPAVGGINTSATVAGFNATDAGENWALCYTNSIEPFMFTAENAVVKIMVYKPILSNVGIKFEGSSLPVEIQVANTVVNQWQELTFNFSGAVGNSYNRLIIIPDFAPRAQDNLIFFDNIILPEGNIVPPAVPTVAAPTPTFAAADVISLFSNAYTNVTVNTWSAGWDAADVANVQIAGNDTKLYTNFTFAGIEFTSNPVNATEMTHFNMDIWTPDSTVMPNSFKIKLVDFGANGTYGGGDDVEHELSFNANSSPALISEDWLSFHIPLSDFTNLITRGHLAQMILSSGPNTVYVDNVYFSASTVAGADASLSNLKVNGNTVAGFSPSILNYNVELPFGSRTPTVTATANDPNANLVVTNTTVLPGTSSVVVTAEDGVTTRTYRVFFTVEGLVPTTAPQVPAHEPEDVIAIYSDAYTIVPGTDFNPFWGQSTVVTVNEVVAGNNTLLYENLNYQGTQFTPQNLGAFEYLHVDFWTANATSLSFFLISPGNEIAEALAITPASWVSLDIPLDNFVPPVNLANVHQFKIVGNGDVWFDNLYFWKTPTAQGTDATLSDLQVEGATVSGFSSLTSSYTMGLVEGTVQVPQITEVSTTDPEATYEINQALAIPGTASVIVTAADGITTLTYTVSFAITTPNSVPDVPTHNAANVISLYSDAYSNVPVDTWLTPWSQGIHEVVVIAGNPVKKYTAVNFVGIETTGANLIDASAMTHIHLDLWTPETNDFKIKLVDWGSNAVWGGGDDSEHEIVYPAPTTGSWISYDIPLSAFTNLAGTGSVAQYILSKPTLGTMYIDNLYFYAAGPDIPANVTIITTATGIELSWDAVSGATSYTVYTSDSPEGPWLPAMGGVYTATGWSAGASATHKFYYVTASNE